MDVHEGGGSQPGDLFGLSQGLRSELLQFFHGFPGEPRDVPEAEAGGDGLPVELPYPCDLLVLLFQVALVFDLGFDVAHLLSGQRERKGSGLMDLPERYPGLAHPFLERYPVSCLEPGRFRHQKIHHAPDPVPFLPELPVFPIRDQSEPVSVFREACIGVVDPELKPVLGPGGEQAVGLFHTAADQVVDQHSQIGLFPAQDEGRGSLDPEGGVDPGHQALGRRLLVPGGAVDLSGQVQGLEGPCFQRGFQGGGGNGIVFDGIRRAQDPGLVEPGYAPEYRFLDGKGE